MVTRTVDLAIWPVAVAQAGPVAVALFAAPTGLPASINGVAGDPEVVRQIKKRPANYYLNLHNAEFTAGAVRGHLSKTG